MDVKATEVCNQELILTTPYPCQADASVQTTFNSEDISCQTEPPKPVKLTAVMNPTISVPPRTIYHPAVINASKSRYNKHPSELSKEEFKSFNQYLHKKRDVYGEPVEFDPIYLPTSMRNCLHCGHLT